MKTNEVPQDIGNLANASMKELCYAIDKKGKYTTKLSDGWKVKTLVLNKSLELIEERAQEFKNNFKKGRISPIPYFMEINRMDLTVLSGYMNKWKWVLKRHFKPLIFDKLSQKILQKYADTFNISVDNFKNCNNE